MTLPDERYRAIMMAKKLMEDLSSSSEIKRVPLAVRQQARAVLRHFPSEYDLDQIERFAPHVLQQRMEPLYKMIKQHEMAESVSKDYAAEGLIKQHPTAAHKTDPTDPNWEPHL
jgi:hypothetical protein